MAETVGTLIDKLTITQLRVWHMREALAGDGLAPERRALCQANLGVIEAQRADLSEELDQLWQNLCAGATAPRVYRQFKLYNDAQLRTASQGPSVAANSRPDGTSRTGT